MRKKEISKSLAVTKEGSFFYDTNDSSLGRKLAIEGVWDPHEAALIKSLIEAGDCVIDIGAHIGWNTVMLAKLTGDTGTVLAYEPDPDNFELLIENIEFNKVDKQTKAYELAILDCDRNIDLGILPGRSVDSRLRFEHLDSSLFPMDKLVFTKVEGRTLDSALARETGIKRQIRLTKIDCPGSEISILRGAEQTLARTQFLIAGCKPSLLIQADFQTEEFGYILQSHFARFARVGEEIVFQPISNLSADLKEAQIADTWNNYLFERLP